MSPSLPLSLSLSLSISLSLSLSLFSVWEFANVPSSWLGRRVSRFGTGIRVTKEPWVPWAGAKVDRDGSLDAGSFKHEMPPERFELGEKGPSSTCNFTR